MKNSKKFPSNKVGFDSIKSVLGKSIVRKFLIKILLEEGVKEVKGKPLKDLSNLEIERYFKKTHKLDPVKFVLTSLSI